MDPINEREPVVDPDVTMEPINEREPESVVDPDVDCRLRYGLNVLCLANIFKYLNTMDLIVLGGMNDFYKQIIHENVISKHIVNFDSINGPAQLELFMQRHAKKIKRIKNLRLIQTVIQLIIRYLSVDQLKSVECHSAVDVFVLPSHFYKLERFIHTGITYMYPYPLNVRFSENLRLMKLSRIDLHQHFDWSELINLVELHLIRVRGIIDHAFINYLAKRPKLERFYHRDSLTESMERIGSALGKYCGDRLKIFHDENEFIEMGRHFYDYLTKMTVLKEIGLLNNYRCSRNLIYPIKYLSECNSIEKLVFHTCSVPLISDDCFSRRRRISINKFSKLKEIRMFTNDIPGERVASCDRMSFLIRNADAIFGNVEKCEIIIETRPRNWCFLGCMPKLRELWIVRDKTSHYYECPETWDARIIFDYLKNIIKNNPGTEIKLIVDEYCYEVFYQSRYSDDAIKVSRIHNYDFYHSFNDYISFLD